MKKLIAPFLILFLFWGCGVPKHTKDLLNLSFKNKVRDFYIEKGFFLTDFTGEVVTMKYYKKGLTMDEPEYNGLIHCKFRDGNNSVSIWYTVGFDQYWHVQQMPEVYGVDKWNIYAFDLLVNTGKDVFFTDPRTSPYVLDRFLNRNDYLKNKKDTVQ